MTTAQDLKERYRKLKFIVREPVLELGGADGRFLESQGIEKATIAEWDSNFSNKKYSYVHADLTKKLPEFKEKFRTIFIMEVLEHLKNPLYLMTNVYDILADEGICYIAVPYTKIGEDIHHVRRWTRKEIINQMKNVGFNAEVIQSRRRFRGLGFFLPHCWLVVKLTKRLENSSKINVQLKQEKY